MATAALGVVDKWKQEYNDRQMIKGSIKEVAIFTLQEMKRTTVRYISECCPAGDGRKKSLEHVTKGFQAAVESIINER